MNFRERAFRILFGMAAAAVLTGCQTKVDTQPSAQPQFDPQVAAIEERMQTIARGLERYRGDVGDYPQKLDDLFASDAAGWKGPYVNTGPPAAPGAPSYTVDQQLTDLWGNRYEYTHDAKSAQVISFGPDKTKGTEDDIVVTASPSP